MMARDPEKARARYRRYAEKNRAKRNAQSQAWRDRNPDKLKSYDKSYYAANRDHILEKNREWAASNRVRVNARAKKFYHENAERLRLEAVARRYGLTAAGLAALKESQFNRCGICGVSFDHARPEVDHDHATGHVRGLLCCRCNRGIGQFGDNPTSLVSAAVYLRSAKESGAPASLSN